MKKTVKYFLTFICMILIFCVVLTITSMIPQNLIQSKVKESSQILDIETNRLMIKIPSKRICMMFDNFTDALMINTAYSIDTDKPFYSALMGRKNYIKGVTTNIYKDTTGELKSSSKYTSLDQVGDLKDTINKGTTESFEYARYWHGYLIFLRPLLMLFNISQIRIILTILLFSLAIILLYLIYKRIGLITMIVFLLGMIICDYFYMGLSLQGAPIFILCMIVSIIILYKKSIDNPLLFMIIGGLTNFFDFLTVPIITLCIPLILYVMLIQKENNYKKIYLDMIKLTLFWGIGYVGTWLMKWLITDIIFNKGLIYASFEQLKYRSGMDNTIHYNIFNVIEIILKIVIIPFGISIMLIIIINLCNIIKNRKSVFKLKCKEVLPYVFVLLIPLAWYAVLSNHSYLHSIFTYRNFFVISICILTILYNVLSITKKND